MPLRVILGEGPYAILGPTLSYSVYAAADGVFTYYVPAHNSHRRRERRTRAVTRDRVDHSRRDFKETAAGYNYRQQSLT